MDLKITYFVAFRAEFIKLCSCFLPFKHAVTKRYDGTTGPCCQILKYILLLKIEFELIQQEQRQDLIWTTVNERYGNCSGKGHQYWS